MRPKNFGKWKKLARAKVFECMMAAPPKAESYDMRVLAEEKREGYTARKLEFRLSRWYSVKAYLLVPDGVGPFPAVNLLHDHGAHLSIGKEKMIRPFAVDNSVVEDADAGVTAGHAAGMDVAALGAATASGRADYDLEKFEDLYGVLEG